MCAAATDGARPLLAVLRNAVCGVAALLWLLGLNFKSENDNFPVTLACLCACWIRPSLSVCCVARPVAPMPGAFVSQAALCAARLVRYCAYVTVSSQLLIATDCNQATLPADA